MHIQRLAPSFSERQIYRDFEYICFEHAVEKFSLLSKKGNLEGAKVDENLFYHSTQRLPAERYVLIVLNIFSKYFQLIFNKNIFINVLNLKAQFPKPVNKAALKVATKYIP